MTFEHPWLLLLLIIPVCLGFWEFFREAHALVVPFDNIKRRWYQTLTGFLVRILQLIPAFLMAAAIFILAEPRRIGPPESEREMTNVIIAVDLSGSMTAEFGNRNESRHGPNMFVQQGLVSVGEEKKPYTRHDAAVDALKDFASYREGDAFGLMFFGSSYLHWLPVTRDLNALKTCADLITPNNAPSGFGGTMIGSALEGALAKLVEIPEGDRMIILISDGESADLNGGQDVRIAEMLHDERVVTYFVSVNSSEVPRELHTIAGITGGEVLVADNKDDLLRVFQHIDRMTKIKMKQRDAEPVTYYAPFAAASILLSLLMLVNFCGVRYTPW